MAVKQPSECRLHCVRRCETTSFSKASSRPKLYVDPSGVHLCRPTCRNQDESQGKAGPSFFCVTVQSHRSIRLSHLDVDVARAKVKLIQQFLLFFFFCVNKRKGENDGDNY